MKEPSVFQAQYPLSPKKFRKKVLGRLLSFFFLILFFGVFIGGMISAFSGEDSGKAIVINIAGTFVTLFIVSVVLYSWYIKAYIRRYYYDCGDQFVTIQKGVFAPTEIHVQYQKIQDVYVDQDVLDRMMGLYDVHIASATIMSGIEAHIDGVEESVAEALKNIILSKIHNADKASQPEQVPIPQPQSGPIQFSQKISSETYPISGKWVWSALISSFFGTLFFTLVIGVLLTMFLGHYLLQLLNSGLIWIVGYFFILFIYQIIWNYTWKRNFYFEFLPDYILLRKGFISKQENHLPYKSIQNILNKQDILDRILGLSTIVIENAAQGFPLAPGRQMPMLRSSAISLVWQPKDKAEELNRILNSIVSKINPQNSSRMGV